MTNLTILEHNATTGEILERLMTEQEIAQAKADVLQAETDRKTKEDQDQADAIAKAALLNRLGISEEEAKLLLKQAYS